MRDPVSVCWPGSHFHCGIVDCVVYSRLFCLSYCFVCIVYDVLSVLVTVISSFPVVSRGVVDTCFWHIPFSFLRQTEREVIFLWRCCSLAFRRLHSVGMSIPCTGLPLFGNFWRPGNAEFCDISRLPEIPEKKSGKCPESGRSGEEFVWSGMFDSDTWAIGVMGRGQNWFSDISVWPVHYLSWLFIRWNACKKRNLCSVCCLQFCLEKFGIFSVCTVVTPCLAVWQLWWHQTDVCSVLKAESQDACFH